MRSENDLLIIDCENGLAVNSQLSIADSDEEDPLFDEETDYEIQETPRRASRCNFLPIVILILSAFIVVTYLYPGAQLQQIEVVEGIKYNILRTAYPNNLTQHQKTKNSAQQLEQQNISLYLQEQQVAKVRNNESAQYINNFLVNGKMVDELEAWILSEVKGYEKCLLFWNDRLAIAAILLGQKLKSKQKGDMLILVGQRSQVFEGFKLTIKRLGLDEIITVLNTIEWIFPRKISSYNIIVTPGLYFHTKILQDEMQKMNPFSRQIEQQLSRSFQQEYIDSKIVLLYQGELSQTQTASLRQLNNKVALLDKAFTAPFYNLIPLIRSKQHLLLQRANNIVLVLNQSKLNEAKEDIAETSKTELEIVEENKDEKWKQHEIQEHYNLHFGENVRESVDIRRISAGQLNLKIVCAQKTENREQSTQKSMFQTIKILANIREGEEFEDYSHLAKFLASYYQAIPFQASSFYCMQSQIIANLIAQLSKRNMLVPFQQLKNENLIEKSLLTNKFQKAYVMVSLVTTDFITLIEDNHVKLLYVELHYLDKWSTNLQAAMRQGTDLLTRRSANTRDLSELKGYYEKGFKIYVIFYREKSEYDIDCIRDYQMEIIDFQREYPANSFYLISSAFINTDGYDPVEFANSTYKRKFEIQPYQCAEPPYSTIKQESTIGGYLLTDNKYHLPVYLDTQQVLLYKQTGAVDEDFIEFVNSCFVSSDKIFMHSQAIENWLLVVALAKKVEPYGALYFTSMNEDKESLLMRNLKKNDVEGPVQVLGIHSSDEIKVKQYIFRNRPSVIIITIEVLPLYEEVLEYLPKGTLIILKYSNTLLYNGTIARLKPKYLLYLIATQPKEKLSYNRCANYQAVLLTPQTEKATAGWIFFQI